MRNFIRHMMLIPLFLLGMLTQGAGQDQYVNRGGTLYVFETHADTVVKAIGANAMIVFDKEKRVVTVSGELKDLSSESDTLLDFLNKIDPTEFLFKGKVLTRRTNESIDGDKKKDFTVDGDLLFNGIELPKTISVVRFPETSTHEFDSKMDVNIEIDLAEYGINTEGSGFGKYLHLRMVQMIYNDNKN